MAGKFVAMWCMHANVIVLLIFTAYYLQRLDFLLNLQMSFQQGQAALSFRSCTSSTQLKANSLSM